MESPLTALSKLWDSVLQRAEEDEAFRVLLQNGAAALHQLAAQLGQAHPEPVAPTPEDSHPPVPSAPAEAELYRASYPRADAESVDDEVGTGLIRETYSDRAGESTLADLCAALDLKGRAAAWLAEHGYTRDPEALLTRAALIGEARAGTWYLWNLDSRYVDTKASAAHRLLAASYENTARALDLWKQTGNGLDNRLDNREAATLLAEAQSALTVMVMDVYKGPRQRFFDEHQHAAFRALHLMAEENGFTLPFMRLGDAANPEDHAALTGRLVAFAERLETRNQDDKKRKKLLSSLRHHVKKLVGGSDDADYDRQRVVELVRAFGEHFPLNDVNLRQALAPLADCSLDVVGDVLAHKEAEAAP